MLDGVADTKQKLKSPVRREWLSIFLLLTLLMLLASRFDWLTRLDQQAYDVAIRLWERPALSEIVIVGVDEASLQQLGRWPWRRAIQATLIDNISAAAPAAIGLDIILTEPDKTDAAADKLLAKSIAKAGNVVLVVIPRIEEGAIYGEALPVSPIREAGAAFATIQSQTDQDGVMRSIHLRGGAGEAKYRLLGWETLLMSGLVADIGDAAVVGKTDNIAAAPSSFAPVKELERNAAAWVSESPFLIPFAGPPGHFNVIPAVDILRGDVNPAQLTGKLVLIGVTASALGDQYPTPVSGETRAMPGVEVHANVMQAIVEGVSLKIVGRTESAFIAIALLLLVMGGYLRFSPRASIGLAAGCALLFLVVSILVFRLGQLWLSPMLAIVIIALSYPLWSWRKLEATQRYFDQELTRLNNEPDVVPSGAAYLLVASSMATPLQVRQSRMADVLSLRIDAVTAATDQLRSLKRFVADSIESLPIAALVVDFDDKIMLSNSAADRLFNDVGAATKSISLPALEGQTLMSVLAQLGPTESITWREYIAKLHQALLADNNQIKPFAAAPITVEAKSVSATIERDCVVQFAPLYSHIGRATGIIVTVADITPLRESERRRDEALRFLSHDMRSPQASIITLIDMAREDPDSISQTTLMDRISKYSRRTLNLADDFLRLAKAERAKPADFRAIELTEILLDVVEEVTITATQKSITVLPLISPDEAWVTGDRDLMTRAVINLVSNAIKYSPENTTVTIALTLQHAEHDNKQNKQWKIDVQDEGMGISPANLSRLFMRFQRLHQEGQPQTDGIGLGLVFVKTVIERMGGEVIVDSRVAATTDGQHGTTFTVLLAATDPDA